MKELSNKYRPKMFKHVFGQPKAVKQLQGFLKSDKVPHALLFHGPSGDGKTTLARIMAAKLNCGKRDLKEVDCGDFRGIEMIRDLKKVIHLKPLGGETRVWIIDEAHKMTSDGQDAVLKTLEEPPSFAYIMLCTTDPGKLKNTIHTRCTKIKIDALKYDDLDKLVCHVLKKEEASITDDVKDKLIQSADGSARQALVSLHALLQFEDEEDQLRSIESTSGKGEAYQIGVGLLYKREQWHVLAKIIASLEGENWEGIRMLILTMASNILLDPKKAKLHARAYQIQVAFSEPFYNTGRNGLVMSCYEASRQKAR